MKIDINNYEYNEIIKDILKIENSKNRILSTSQD